jgi:Tesmin/TSO1-like CXC domain, cysteine-rich domain
MNYLPGEHGRAFRVIRDDERDDGLAASRRDGYIEWSNHPSAGQQESAFNTVTYRREAQRRLPLNHEQLTWRPVSEREWRRHVPTGTLRDGRLLQMDHAQLNLTASTPWATSNDGASAVVFRTPSTWSRGPCPSVAEINDHNEQLVRMDTAQMNLAASTPWATSNDGASAVVFRTPSTWSRGTRPSVAEINDHNKQLVMRTLSSRGASHEQYAAQREAQAAINRAGQGHGSPEVEVHAHTHTRQRVACGGREPEPYSTQRNVQANVHHEAQSDVLGNAHQGVQQELPVHRRRSGQHEAPGFRHHAVKRGTGALQHHSAHSKAPTLQHQNVRCEAQTQHQLNVHCDVQSISMSSSTTSSATSGIYRSPTETKIGAKRQSGAVASSPPPSPSTLFEAQNETTSKRSKSTTSPPPPPLNFANFDKLDLLCQATLEMGPLQENPSGCSCPKSRCIALYCDCFKAGRRCNPDTCTCLNCKNTVHESGINGARTVAIRTILARNPRAFTTAGLGKAPKELPPGQIACNCIRSRCLKLYCGCFQAGKACDPELCTCISCLNTEEDVGGHRRSAIQQCLEKRPNAFQIKPKDAGLGCACKNNR